MFAAKGGNLELVKLLVEHGAEINAGALSGATPLQFACMEGKIEMVNYLIERGASLTNATASLSWAAWRGYSNIVILLVEKGVPVDRSAGELGTPLQKAIDGGFVNIAAFLIKHGADINKAARGSTPLHNAVRWGSPETVKFILEAGANPNARDSYGFTPLMYAVSVNHSEAAKLLLENKAEPQLKNPRGQTAMDLASQNLPNKEITALFVQFGLIKPVQPKEQKP
jgi:ankyrin repeat protein